MVMRAIQKGKQWLENFLGTTPQEPRKETPATLPPDRMVVPANQEPTPAKAQYADPISDSHPVEPTKPDSGPPALRQGGSEALRRWIDECMSLRSFAEAQMLKLRDRYRSSMPRCRLQLFPWAYPKGSPIRCLYWVRLSEKRNQFTSHGFPILTKPRRWFKVLRIRNRSDLHDATYWLGLANHRKTVMSFYDSWRALNTSRSILTRAMKFSKHAIRSHLKSSGTGKGAEPDPGKDPSGATPDRTGWEFYVLAEKFGQLLQGTYNALEELQKRTATLPFRLVLSADGEGFDRVVEWEHGPSGRKYRKLRAPSLRRLHLSPADQAATRLAVSECKKLLKTLRKRLYILRKAESRLCVAQFKADQLLRPRPLY